jgi:hypothetical protein
LTPPAAEEKGKERDDAEVRREKTKETRERRE